MMQIDITDGEKEVFETSVKEVQKTFELVVTIMERFDGVTRFNLKAELTETYYHLGFTVANRMAAKEIHG